DEDPDLVGDQHAAGLEGGVPGEPELLAGDRGLAGEARTVDAEGVGGRALVAEVELDRPGDVADGEIADEGVACDLGGDEADLREVLRIEEVAAAQVVVAVLVGGADRPGPQAAAEGEVPAALAHLEDALDLVELAAGAGDAGVTHRERRRGVSGIEGPGAGSEVVHRSLLERIGGGGPVIVHD